MVTCFGNTRINIILFIKYNNVTKGRKNENLYCINKHLQLNVNLVMLLVHQNIKADNNWKMTFDHNNDLDI